MTVITTSIYVNASVNVNVHHKHKSLQVNDKWNCFLGGKSTLERGTCNLAVLCSLWITRKSRQTEVKKAKGVKNAQLQRKTYTRECERLKQLS